VNLPTIDGVALAVVGALLSLAFFTGKLHERDCAKHSRSHRKRHGLPR
jgi:hypothetical protein